jgi:OmpA-OmpF porin, OOP family
MKQNKIALAVVAVLSAALSACSTVPGKDGSHTNPLCMFAGAAVGGGGAAAIAAAAGPIGAGVLIGAVLGSLACTEGAPVVTPVAVAATPPPAVPVPVVAERDSDGDGVMDGVDLCPGTPPGTKVDANGCPPILLTLTGVHFKFDSSAIEPASEPILGQAVAALAAAPAVQVTVVGHTDSVGTDDYNVQLSDRRAKAVVEYLVGQGVAAHRLSAEGRGEREPVQSNDTVAGRYENRRVELHTSGAARGNGTPQ